MINLLNKTGLGRSGHDWSQSFGSISHVSGPKLIDWGNFIMVLNGFARRSSKNMVLRPTNIKHIRKDKKIPKTIPPYVPPS